MGDILEEYEGRSRPRDDAGDMRPEVARVVRAAAFARDGERLARIARSDDVHRASPRAAVEGGNVVPDRRAIPGTRLPSAPRGWPRRRRPARRDPQHDIRGMRGGARGRARRHRSRARGRRGTRRRLRQAGRRKVEPRPSTSSGRVGPLGGARSLAQPARPSLRRRSDRRRLGSRRARSRLASARWRRST